jgi:hypothetical protein
MHFTIQREVLLKPLQLVAGGLNATVRPARYRQMLLLVVEGQQPSLTVLTWKLS